MNKRRLHHFWTRFRKIKPWYFLMLALLSGVVCILALRANNQHMITLRDAVYKADKENGDVQTALQNLQAYVTHHMNTNLDAGPNAVYPPIQLKYTYDRLVRAQSANATQSNAQVYTEAQHYCEQQNSRDFSGRNRIPCIQQYVQSHTATKVPSTTTIPDALYKFAFFTPRWSPDLAGWTMLLTIIFGLLFILTWTVDWWLRRYAA